MLTVDAIARQLSPVLRSKPVQRAYLFGSYARGEARPQSDVDILIEFDERQLVGMIEYIRLMDECAAALQHNVDVVATDGLSPHIAPAVHREKVLIYEA